MHTEPTASTLPFFGRRLRRIIPVIILLTLLPMRSSASLAAGRWSDSTLLPATGNSPSAPIVPPRGEARSLRAVPAGVANTPARLRANAGPPPFPQVPLVIPFPSKHHTTVGPVPLGGSALLKRTAGPTASLSIQRGWNLISLPLTPTTPLSATTLLAAVLTATSGRLAALYGLTNNAWSPVALDNDGHFGASDFPLQVGIGYLLYADAPGTLTLSGTVPAAPIWSLTGGWNLVGLPQGATTTISATTVLTSLLGGTAGHLAALYALANGVWSPGVLDVGGHLSPTDFALGAGQGYLLFTDRAAHSFAVPGFLPPDPGTVAPVIDPSVSTTVFSATSFLYSGADPIQTGVAPGTIDVTRTAVLRGKVVGGDGQPLPGVTITILSHPEYGQTLSRADGMFDMVVNGGSLLTVTYSKDGYLPVQRHAQAPWQNYLRLPDVMMTTYDSHVTAITLSSAAALQVARSSVETDASGTRQATLLFPQGTTATMTLPNGTMQPLTSVHVRATEVTVGANGLQAMPGELPPTSSYTYAADFSVDEATATGAISVTFNQPVYSYVENFLGFPTGTPVPSGYYDRTLGRWVASQNGLVIKILSISGGKASLDVDGSGTPASPSTLAALGITSAEQQELAVLYQAGQSLWRVPLSHFSFFDFNWPAGCPINPDGTVSCTPPDEPDPSEPPCTCEATAQGSVIGIQTQTLGEDIGVTGTPFQLHYASDRVAGRTAERTLKIPLSGAIISPTLAGITLEIDVAGQSFSRSFPAAPNQSYTFVWDGNDVYGRELQGAQPVTVRIGYTYPVVYLDPPDFAKSFAWLSGLDFFGIPGRNTITLYQTWQHMLGGWDDALANGALGGWTLNVHHTYDVGGRVLYQGDGTKRSAQAVSEIITSAAGSRSAEPDPGEGVPAREVQLGTLQDTAFGPDGTLYITDGARVVRVGLDGRLHTVAGNGQQCLYNVGPPANSCGDGGPATAAEFGINGPRGIVVGPDGSLYVADTYNNRIRRVDSHGIITTVAGGGAPCGDPGKGCGDGGPATQAVLGYPQDVALGRDGSLYIADTSDNRIRRVDSHGIITTVAGNGSPNCLSVASTPSACFGGDGAPASKAELYFPTGIAFGPDGSLTIADTDNYRIRRVDPHGIITTVAGNGSSGCLSSSGNSPACYGGDGGPATEARLDDAQDVALGSDGTLYVADSGNNRIRRVAPDGTITTMVGNGAQGLTGDGGPAAWATLTQPGSVTVGPDGGLYLTSTQDGRVRRVGVDGYIGTVAGWGVGGDGSPAVVAAVGSVQALTTGPDGSMYFVDAEVGTVRRVSPDGIITTVAGGGPSCADPSGACGDGGPATRAALNLGGLTDIALGPVGGLYIAAGTRIRFVDPDGIITTIAGTGQSCTDLTQNLCGDGGPATAAQFVDATSLAFGPNDALYIVDSTRIRAIMPDGIIRTVAGGGNAYPGDGGPATQARLYGQKIAVGPDGSLYVAAESRVARVGPDGMLSTVAGQPYATCFSLTDPCGDGGPATKAELGSATAVTLGADGSLYIVDQGVNRIRRITPDGTIITVVGDGQSCNTFAQPIPLCGDGGPSTGAQLTSPNAVIVRPDGHLCIGDEARVRCVGPALPGLALDGSVIPSIDGGELYVFDANGRHLRTLDALTLAVRYQFGYDSAGHLITVTDGDGNVTTIQRDGAGHPLAIVAPGGQRTTLATDANGYLSGLTDPAGDRTRLASTAGGLLTSLTDPKGDVHRFSYDDEGRLAQDSDPAGGSTSLARIDATDGFTVTETTALGRATTDSVQRLPSGVVQETSIDPSGARTVLDVGTDDSRTISYPDGTREVQLLGPDPRFGIQAPILTSDTVTTPAGLVNTTLTTRTVVLANPDDPLTLQSLSDTLSTDGRTTTSLFDAATGVITETTAAGRRNVVTLDHEGRPITVVPDEAIAPISAVYDAHGRLATIRQGAQSVTLTYDAGNRLTAQTDASGAVTSFGYDAANRVIGETLPGGEKYQFIYDADGNRTAVVMPGGAKHTLAYTPIDQVAGYSPPGNAAYSQQYNVDRAPTTLTLPDGRSVTETYDANGRPTGVTSSDSAATYSYADTTDRISQITGTAGSGPAQGLAFGYDGFLSTSLTVSGTAQGSSTFSYDANFALTRITLSSSSDHLIIPFTYDADLVPTGIGPFTVAPTGPAGAPNRISDGAWSRTLSYDSLAQTTGYTDTVSGNTAYAAGLAYDNRGRLVSKVETTAGTAHTYAYTYDPDGQLTKVTRDGTTVEQYGYDSDGNRTSVKLGSNPVVTAIYDTQDRLQRQGSTTYSFDADGYLTHRGSDTFSYSARGALLTATAGGHTVTYAYDGLGRRVGRTDSVGTTSYLYGNPGDPFQVTAVRDTSGMLSTLIYDASGLLIAIERGGTRYYVSTDLLGSPRVVTDGAGRVLKTLQYDSFGNITVAGGSDPSFFLPVGFAGGLSDAVTGLVHFGFRDYDPLAGRWTARDPSLYAGGQGNLYAYAGNDPVGHYDPTGLYSWSQFVSDAKSLYDDFNTWRDRLEWVQKIKQYFNRSQDPNKDLPHQGQDLLHCLVEAFRPITSKLPYGDQVTDELHNGIDTDIKIVDASRKSEDSTIERNFSIAEH